MKHQPDIFKNSKQVQSQGLKPGFLGSKASASANIWWSKAYQWVHESVTASAFPILLNNEEKEGKWRYLQTQAIWATSGSAQSETFYQDTIVKCHKTF